MHITRPDPSLQLSRPGGLLLFALLKVKVDGSGVRWPLPEARWLPGGRGHRQSPWPGAPGWHSPSAGISVTDTGSQRPLRHTSDKQQMLKGFVFPPGGAARALVYCGRGASASLTSGALARGWQVPGNGGRPCACRLHSTVSPGPCRAPLQWGPAPCSPCPAGAPASWPHAELGFIGDARRCR